MKILFAPVGGTDPISESNYHEGPILQITRHFQPDIIYLYMSGEILEKHRQDNRYLYCLEQMKKSLDISFEVRIIEENELIDVHLFDPIYSALEGELEKITEGLGEEDELLLNISSGTPSMKSALIVLATMLDLPCKCVQVDTPQKGMNQHIHSDNLDIETLWELNVDNDPEMADAGSNRTHVVELVSLKRLKYEATIKKLVLEYDYHAAFLLAKDMRVRQNEPYMIRLQIADARYRLDFDKVDELLEKYGDLVDPHMYCPIVNNNSRMPYEYMLLLQLRVDRGEYGDFIRAISPIIMDLFEGILREQANWRLSDYTRVTSRGVRKWDGTKLRAEDQGILNRTHSGRFDSNSVVKTSHLKALIDAKIADPNVIQCVRLLRINIEEGVRNIAAHDMVSISNNFVYNKTGYGSREILDILKEAFSYTDYRIDPKLWDSYYDMNNDILSVMQ